MNRPTDIHLTIGTGGDGIEAVALPLDKAPHILVAGMTGGGKSVVIHDFITQLIQRDPRYLNLVLIDPKRVEFSRYAGIRHLAWPWIAHEVHDSDNALKWVEAEMRMRFHRMERAGVRRFDHMPDPWARLVVVIDELANLILMRKALEARIVTIASMGRAAGIHLILATQRPSADVVTGLIRANVPTRICLPVITKMESRIVLDVPGAEELHQPGDMLIRVPGRRALVRSRGHLVSDDEIEAAVRGAR